MIDADRREHNPFTARVYGAIPRRLVRFRGLKFIWYFIFPLKGNVFQLQPPRGYYWESDAELRKRILEIQITE